MQESKESFDLHIVNVPKTWKWVRKGRKMRKEHVSRVPIILRDLAPSTGFNPQTVWENEKRRELQAGASVDEESLDTIICHHLGRGNAAQRSSKGSRTTQIQAKQQLVRAEKTFQEDMVRMSNAMSHKTHEGLLHILRQTETPCGSLALLIQILTISMEKKQYIEMYDVLWAIQEHAHYQRGKQELREAISKVASPARLDLSSLSHCARLIIENRATLIQAKRIRDRQNMIEKQLTEMSDRLPPLSRYKSGFRLDDWQKQVLRWIDESKSVIISAPTSSGKTILSAYVASLGSQEATLKKHAASQKQKRKRLRRGRRDEEEEDASGSGLSLYKTIGDSEPYAVLFVVPTEPLVWQVAAQFYKYTTSNIALISNHITYSSHTNINYPPSVVVGTPLALETALIKARGRKSYYEKDGKADMEVLPSGIHHYKWAVYDEIHSLNGEEGDALQRLIRMMDCKFLALSATIGNARELQSWMEQVKGDQFGEDEVETVTVREGKTEEEEEKEHSVELIVHETRFIDLQRHIWTRSSMVTGEGLEDGEAGLSTLHPLSAVKLETLQQGFSSTVSLPFTAKDNYDLWCVLKETFGEEEGSPVSDVNPSNFFDKDDRLTLFDINRYERFLKVKLESLATDYPQQMQTVLDRFMLPEIALEFDICDLILDLKDRNMLPCVVFHTNTFEALSIFQKIVQGLEQRQVTEFPNYENELIEKQMQMDQDYQDKLKENQKLQMQLNAKSKEDRSDILQALQASKSDSVRQVIDTSAPHPKYVLNPPGLPKREYEEMCQAVNKEDRFKGSTSKHALMRALRRGVGIVMNDSVMQEYRRTVMRLAMQNKLAVVVSDESLAYGVNMPFRSVVFPSGMEGQLDPLVLQQMAGRAGRRGLDTQGHYVYAGMSKESVKDLMLSPIPAIEGKNPVNYAVSAPLSLHVELDFPYDYLEDKLFDVCNESLAHSIDRKKGQASDDWENFNETSRELLMNLGLASEDEDGVLHCTEEERPLVALLWELRYCEPQVFTYVMAFDFLEHEFAKAASHRNDSVTSQLEFLAYTLLVFDRYPLVEGEEPILESYLAKRAELSQKVDEFKAKLTDIQEQLREESGGNHLDLPLMPVDTPLDGVMFETFVSNEVPPKLSSKRKHELLKRIINLSIILATVHNCIHPYPNKFGRLIPILRKSFLRLRYIAREAVERDLNFDDVCSSHVFVDDEKDDDEEEEEEDDPSLVQWEGEDDEEEEEEEEEDLIDFSQLEVYGLIDVSQLSPENIEVVGMK